MRRTWTATAGGLGALLAFLLGSGLIATVSDSIVSPGNIAQSGTFEPPTHDVKVATSAPCGGEEVYEDGPIAAVFQSGSGGFVDGGGGAANLNLNEDSPGLRSDRFCFKNTGTETGELTVSFANVADTEVGTCEASESDPSGGGDTTCSDSDQGELKQLLRLSVSQSGGTSTSCPNGGFIDASFAGAEEGRAIRIAQELAPGEDCQVEFSLYVPSGVGDTERLAAQTDRVQWDMVFTLQDVAA